MLLAENYFLISLFGISIQDFEKNHIHFNEKCFSIIVILERYFYMQIFPNKERKTDNIISK